MADESKFLRYPLEELVYASDYEKAYGIRDDQYEYYCRQQHRLCRFEAQPRHRCDASLLTSLERQRQHLARSGFDPTEDGGIFESIRIDFVHSTAALEGSTLSVYDVAQILEHDAVVPSGSLREHVEVVDISDAFDVAVACARAERPLSVELLCELHAIAARHLHDCEAGELRWDQRYVTGARVLPPPATLVPSLLEQAVAWYNARPSLEGAALFHLVLEDIHPFQDGNGRVGRIALNMMLMELGYPACALKADEEAARRYQRAVRDFAETIEDRDGTAMVELLADALSAAMARYLKAAEQARR